MVTPSSSNGSGDGSACGDPLFFLLDNMDFKPTLNCALLLPLVVRLNGEEEDPSALLFIASSVFSLSPATKYSDSATHK
jgi:hypothetical protein